ncbi:MAG: sulfite exporter TauE/SafE family protein [Myxococcales bacterium]|nr:sulfite exporter TauE/SafE family protein [Myxococcales bacterium]
MTLLALAVMAAVLFAVSALAALLGQGGGVLYTPIQIFAGVRFHEAATTSLFLIMVTSLSATLVFRRGHRVDWPLAGVLEAATALGAFVGGMGSEYLSGSFLMGLFSAVLVFAAVFMLRDLGARATPASESRRPFVWRRSFDAYDYGVNLLIALPASFAAGAVSGLIGVGGGLLKVPLMVVVLGVPMEIAVGSSAFMVGITATGGLAGHIVSGHWNPRTALILAVAVFAGARIGARKSLTVDKDRLKRGFGWFLLAIAALMLGRAVL